MDRESWTQLNRLLDEALDLPSDDVESWLAGLGPDEKRLQARARALLGLRPSVQASAFLESLPPLSWPAAAGVDNSDAQLLDAMMDVESAGAIVGPYRLLRPIGAGGMGTVWLAERADGLLQREVALKLPNCSWRPDLVARMGRERDILSTLEHPNIARLYDAGVTPEGRPYLALEYVAGRSIGAYCKEERLDVRARVRLFLQVVQAVAYAHGRLVVHRDLKPSNILVTHDGQVRLLDFGVAKLLDAGNDRSAWADRPGRASAHTRVRVAGADRRGAAEHGVRHLFARRRALRAPGGQAPVHDPPGLRPRPGDRDPRDRSGPAERVDDDRLAPEDPARRSRHDRAQDAQEALGRALRARSTRWATISTAGSTGVRCSRDPTAPDTACRSSSGATRLPSRRRPSSWPAWRRSASSRRGRRACWPSSVAWRRSNGTPPSRSSAS